MLSLDVDDSGLEVDFGEFGREVDIVSIGELILKRFFFERDSHQALIPLVGSVLDRS